MALPTIFSDVDWVRTDLPSVTTDDFSNTQITTAIRDGDKEIKDDLNKMIDFEKLSSVPEAMKRMSHYKACEIVLLRVVNNPAIVEDENSLMNYWKGKYDKLLKDIRDGKVALKDSSHDEYEADEVVQPRLGRII